MKRHRRTNLNAILCALASVFLVLYGCGGDDGGSGIPIAGPYSISGTVVTFGPLPGVTMTLSGASSATTTTDNTGNYIFIGLDNGTYTITPSKTGYTFSPASSPQTVSGANITGVNFTATPTIAGPYSISGTVVTFGPLSGVTMTLSGASSATITTDVSGNYTFTGLDNGSYTITPSKTGYTFSPASSPQTVSGVSITGVIFNATQVQPASPNISGQVVSTTTSSGLSNVRIDFSGVSGSGNVTTDASGNYTIFPFGPGLANGIYTITPRRTGFTFSPASSTQTVSGADITGVNFTATQLQTNVYTIFGSVYAGSPTDTTGLIGVTMTLSGASAATITTDIYGTYRFISLANGSYTITPSKPGFTFSPASSTQTVSNADILTGVRFAATSTPIGPIVTCPPSGAADVTIQNFAFTPQTVTISANGIVRWIDSGTTHTVTSGTSSTPDGKFNSGNLGTGDTFCVQFLTTGTYNYFCNVFPYAMVGSVVVQ